MADLVAQTAASHTYRRVRDLFRSAEVFALDKDSPHDSYTLGAVHKGTAGRAAMTDTDRGENAYENVSVEHRSSGRRDHARCGARIRASDASATNHR